MLVGERMSHPVITVNPNTSLEKALTLMRDEGIRRLPVVNRHGHLVGIVSEGDLLNASPSDATSLSKWELKYLMRKITIEEIMTKNVITVEANTSLEEAALLMANNKVGGLPVVQDGKVIGIITETDLFKIFLELLGAHEPGIRLEALVPNVHGVLADLTAAISNIGGVIVALGTFLGESTANREVCIKVSGVSQMSLQEAIKPYVEKIVDIREPQLV